MTTSTFVRMKGDLAVCVPADLSCLTRYVLLEQEDWFPEATFIRTSLPPGAKVIDAGALYGLHTLVAARAVGAQGTVWSFEADPEAHACLLGSLRENNLSNVTPVPTSPDNLDARLSEPGFREAAFLRIAAAENVAAVIEGARRFLSEASPLVLIEAAPNSAVDPSLLSTLQTQGYRSYVLVPGIGRLAPSSGLDRPAVFCCKTDRAHVLDSGGFLVERTAIIPQVSTDAWRAYLDGFPYGLELRDTFIAYDASAKDPRWRTHRQALCLYAAAMEPERPAAERLGALRRAAELLAHLVKDGANASRLQSFARVAADLGERTLAADLIGAMLQSLNDDTFSFSPEPFLCVSAAYAGMDPGGDPARWAVASLLSAHEALRAPSSYFTGKSTLEALEGIRELGFQSPEMERRRQLVRLRYGLQDAPEPPLSGLPRSPEHLNSDFWTR